MAVAGKRGASSGDVEDDIVAELAALETMSLAGLKARWQALTGRPLPKFMRRGMMTRAVAHAVQENRLGGIDAATAKRLDRLVTGIVPAGDVPPPRKAARRRMKAGTRVLREWQGHVHEVIVVGDGTFLWRGERYRSLSVIARAITGTRWNGWTFFGLDNRKRAAARRIAREEAVAPVRERTMVPAGGRAAASRRREPADA